MIDFLGKQLSIGDKVVGCAHQRTSSTLYYGEIVRFTEKKIVVKIEGPEDDWRVQKSGEERRVYPSSVVKI